MPEILFRCACPADADALGQVHVDARRETYAALMPADVVAGHTVESRAAMWRHILSSPASSDTVVYYAASGNAMIGFAAGGPQRTADLAQSGFDAEIGAIYVLRAFQGRSVGTTLMRRVSAGLAERAHRAVSLWVLRENAAARRFYEHLGGEVIGQRDERRSDMVLVEVAYGWRDLRGVADRRA